MSTVPHTQLQVRLIIVDLIIFIYCCRVPGSKPEYKDIGFLHFAILHKGMSSKIELLLKLFFLLCFFLILLKFPL